jgi:hypothetical protein
MDERQILERLAARHGITIDAVMDIIDVWARSTRPTQEEINQEAKRLLTRLSSATLFPTPSPLASPEPSAAP